MYGGFALLDHSLLHSYAKSIEKQVKSIDVDKEGRKKPLASKS